MADDPTLLGLDIPTAVIVRALRRDFKLGQTFAACGFAVFLWDCLACLHQEYRLCWQSKWSSLKGAYVFTRYITMLYGIILFVGCFDTFSQGACNNYVKAVPAIGTLTLLGVTLLLTARAYNLWDNNRMMLALTLFMGTAQAAFTMCVGISLTHSIPIYPGYVDGCFAAPDSDLYVVYWIVPLLIHAFITVFTVVRAYEVIELKNPSTTAWQRLWQVFTRKYGQVFPLLVIFIEIFQVAFYASTDDTLKAVTTPLSTFLIAVLSCQMVLTMRLTTKSGLSRTSLNSSKATDSGFSRQYGNIGKLAGTGGIQAFVTSNHSYDKEDLDVIPTSIDVHVQNARARAESVIPFARYPAVDQQRFQNCYPVNAVPGRQHLNSSAQEKEVAAVNSPEKQQRRDAAEKGW